MERFVAIDNVCAWPNLTRLPSGEIVATIFNQPCHGRWEGDVECWTSLDEGRSWSFSGVPAPHDPGTNRMNVAAGTTPDGNLIVIASGWSSKPAKEDPPREDGPRCEVLPPWVCRSADGGKTWTREGTVRVPGSLTEPIPFGDVTLGDDGCLAVSLYDHKRGEAEGAPVVNNSYFARSRDGGRTWDDATVIGAANYNETDILCLGGGRWLAAARTRDEGRLDLFASADNGRTWDRQGALTGAMQHPAHLLKLSDGSILLTHGIRYRGLYGVGARASEDGGRTWMPPMFVIDFGGAWDGGYPSSVELPDGRILTAFYSSGGLGHDRYHMGVAIWDMKEQMSRNRRT